MIENRVICDRCGEKCGGSTYYTIDIYGHDINPRIDGRVTLETAGQNVNKNIRKMLGVEKQYCKKCIREIEKYIEQVEGIEGEPGIYGNTMDRMSKIGIYNEHDAIVYLSQEIDIYREKIKYIEQERRQQDER